MPRIRLRAPRTVRGRLTGALAVALTLTLSVAAVVIVLLVRDVLIDRLDDQLRAAGARFAVGLEHDDHDADNRYGSVEGQLAGTLGARILDGRVTEAAIVGSHDSADRVPSAALAVLGRLTADSVPHTVELPEVGQYRVVVVDGRDGDLQVTGLPTAPITRTIDTLAAVVLTVFGVALILVLMLATGLLRVMLRPLARVSTTAGDVAALRLGSGGVHLPHRVEEGPGGSETVTLARAFNAMLEQLEGALQTRADSEERLRRFIADASHELRTPIAVVRSHAELAQRQGGDAIPEEVAHSLTRIAAQSERMGRLVEDLLLLARLDSGRPLVTEPVDVVRTVLDAVDDARAAFPDHRWRLVLPDDPLEVLGEAHALAQVVTNLLANAATHTPAGTTVTATLAVGRTVRITVVDDGPGMPADILERAFDRFVHGGGDRPASRGSSGLGLPIVAAIVAAHRGQVGLTSDTSGTTVRVDLPMPGRSSGG